MLIDWFCNRCSLQFNKKYVFDLHLSLVHGERIEVKKETPICEDKNISDLEAMTSSHLYNLDSASISGYAHPSSHSPYNNQAAHNLLLPSSATYHHPLELNPTSVGPHTNSQHVPIDASEAQQRISHPSGYDFLKT